MREISYREALREALREEMASDPTVFLIGEDIGVYGGAYAVTKGLHTEFGPDRVRDAPISESVIVGAALGAAVAGARAVAEIMYVDFMTLCMDQLVNQAAKIRYMFGGKIRVPLVVRTQGGTGAYCAAQHSQSLEAWFAGVPGLKVLMPSTPYNAKGLLKSAIRDGNVVVFIEHKMLYPCRGLVPESAYTVPIGRAEIARAGSDVTVVAWSRMATVALEAARALSRERIEVEVIDLQTLRPLDIETVSASVRKTGRLVVCEEGCRTGGLGGEIVAQVNERAFDSLDAPTVRVSGLDAPVPFSPPLERACVPDAERLCAGIRSIL